MATANVVKSLDNKFPEALLNQLDPTERQKVVAALGSGDLRLWSPRPTASNSEIWRKMIPGDLVFMYTRNPSNKLRCFPVEAKVESAALGALVWGPTLEGENFRHLYRLGNELESHLTRDSYNRALGYKENNNIQSFAVFEGNSARALIAAAGVLSNDDILEDLAAIDRDNENLTATERLELRKSRIGQGRFRDDLVKRWNACAVTGTATVGLLRASHIKPWCKCTNSERLSADNGLLLLANYDHAFDAGYISFADDGSMVLSARLTSGDMEALGIRIGARLRRVPQGILPFLEYHRREVLKKK